MRSKYVSVVSEQSNTSTRYLYGIVPVIQQPIDGVKITKQHYGVLKKLMLPFVRATYSLGFEAYLVNGNIVHNEAKLLYEQHK